MSDIQGFLPLILLLVLKIYGTRVCKRKARELNRNPHVWGFWGFWFPIIAMIWINNLKPRIKWDEHL